MPKETQADVICKTCHKSIGQITIPDYTQEGDISIPQCPHCNESAYTLHYNPDMLQHGCSGGCGGGCSNHDGCDDDKCDSEE
jgi:hypothetical protein